MSNVLIDNLVIILRLRENGICQSFNFFSDANSNFSKTFSENLM